MLDRKIYHDKCTVDLQDTEERRLVQIDRIFSNQQAVALGAGKHISANVLSIGNSDAIDRRSADHAVGFG